MASADGRSSVNGVVPQNPVVPRIRAAAGSAATQRTATTTNANPSSSSLLHPARSPKSLSRKTRAESVASPDPYYNHSLNPRHHVVRPSSAASNRSFVPGGGSAVGTGRLSRTGRDSPMFFHASEAGHPAPAPQPTHTAAPYVASSGPKFFHADGASVDSTAEPPLRVARAPRVLSASPQIGANGPILAASPSRNMNISPPSSRPASMVGYPASPRPASVAMGNPRTPSLAPAMAENRSRAGFVYANGTEELLQPRKPSGSEIGSATTSPQLPSSPKFGNANPSPKVSYPFSPLASPGLSSPPHYFQRHVSGSSSRRASIDLKSRHGRNASISSVIDLSALKKEEIGHADDEGHSGSGGTGSEEDPEDLEESSAEDEYVPPPPPMPLPGPPVMGMTAAERIKLMEERSANSRRERKVMDLEISNASLLAINKTLEKEMRRQTAELRRYKRLARSGRLSSGASNNNPRSSSPASKRGKSDSDAASIVESEEWEANGSEEDDDTETEKLSEEEGESEDEDGKSDEKHREADEKRLTLDLSKHQALLDASSKMNKSLRGCLLITDQLIREGKKALEYKVRASDVRIGGRILRDEDEEFEDSENLDLESVDGDGQQSDLSRSVSAEGTSAEDELDDAEETETEDDEEAASSSAMAGLGLGFQTLGRPYLLRPEELQPVRHSLV
ncbi:hypothetical protein FN846DRAFT_894679 [Sphaerosporella brunnea]|uniref:Uncharacterized protein n=1 Tax=Sphaerosporella brunnea TaxID=1250544 RepID=A0A5J5EHI3_9PEZI|nr:hypothetical protein FN846DRAFT_894679 [Sphaerosporella brunnea]